MATQPQPTQQTDDIMGLPPLSDEQAAQLPGQAWRQYDNLRVALLLPLSGQHAGVGQAMLKAAEMAVFDVAGDNFTLVIRDTRGTPDGAVQAAEAAMRDGASLILGPLFGSSARTAAPVAIEERVSMIAFTNDGGAAQPGVYVMGLLPSAQVDRVVDYATRQGLQRFAALAPNSAYGDTVVAAFQRAVPASGGEIVRIATHPAGQTQIGSQVKFLGKYDERRRELKRERAKLESRNDEAAKLALKRLENLDTLGDPDFDAVFLPHFGQELRTIAPLMAYYDIDPGTVQFLGTAQWNDPAFAREPNLRGGWFAAPPPEAWDNFASRYSNIYGSRPPRVAALAYDATALAGVLARGGDPRQGPANFGLQQIAQPSGFAGLNGIFRFGADGLVERGLAVLELSEDGITVREAAPQSFQMF